MKNNGKPFDKGKFSSSKNDKRNFKKKEVKESSPPQGIVCYECNGLRHLKKKCPNYFKGKGNVLTTTLSDSKSSNSNSEEECDSDGNFKKLNSVLSSQKPFIEKAGLGYTGKGSLSAKPEMKFVLAKDVEKSKIEIPIVKKDIEPKSKAIGKSIPKNQRGPQVKHFCHHYGI